MEQQKLLHRDDVVVQLTKSALDGVWSSAVFPAAPDGVGGGLRWTVVVDTCSSKGSICLGFSGPNTVGMDVKPGDPCVFIPLMWMGHTGLIYQNNVPVKTQVVETGEIKTGSPCPLNAGDIIDVAFKEDKFSVSNRTTMKQYVWQIPDYNSDGGVPCAAVAISRIGDSVSLRGFSSSTLSSAPRIGSGLSCRRRVKGGWVSARDVIPITLTYPGIRCIHKDPYIYEIDDFLTGDECQYLIDSARPYLAPSAVVASKLKDAGGRIQQLSTSRTSLTCNLDRVNVPDLLTKAERLLQLPRSHMELPQVARYQTTQRYDPHHDAFDLTTEGGRANSRNGGQRVGTLLVYLNDVKTGGCTSFVKLGLKVRPVVVVWACIASASAGVGPCQLFAGVKFLRPLLSTQSFCGYCRRSVCVCFV